MWLSEAMRLGSMACEQSFAQYFEFDLTGEPRAACALGSALLAVGGLGVIDEPCHNWQAWDTKFDVRFRRRTECPGMNCIMQGNSYEVIVHLNDDHHWRRERIATWVETVEKAFAGDEPIQAEVPVAKSATPGTAGTRGGYQAGGTGA